MKIALSLNGKFVCAEQGGDAVGLVHVNRTGIGAWEVWTVERHGEQVALKTVNGRYLSAEMGGGSEVHANRTAVGEWERFAPSDPLKDGARLTLQTSNGRHYLAPRVADADATLAAESTLPTFFVVQVLEGDVTQPDPVTPGAGAEQGFLRVEAPTSGLIWNLVTEDGKPWCFAGYAAHVLPSLVKRDAIDLAAFCAHAKRLGANTIWTIGTHLSPWKTDHGYRLDPREPGYQDVLAKMFDGIATAGMRNFHMALADCDHGLSVPDQKRTWAMTAEVIKNRWNEMLAIGNEGSNKDNAAAGADNANGWLVENFDRPDVGGVLCSTGSTGIGNPPHRKFWDISCWESRRKMNALHKAFDDAGSGVQEQFVGYTGKDGKQYGPWKCAIVVIEPAAFADSNPDHNTDTRWTDERLAKHLGAQIGLNSSGGSFLGSRAMEGQTGGPVETACATAFYTGLRTTFPLR